MKQHTGLPLTQIHHKLQWCELNVLPGRHAYDTTMSLTDVTPSLLQHLRLIFSPPRYYEALFSCFSLKHGSLIGISRARCSQKRQKKHCRKITQELFCNLHSSKSLIRHKINFYDFPGNHGEKRKQSLVGIQPSWSTKRPRRTRRDIRVDLNL
jgi:hypothetical protein